ncbi:LysR family transcriptional regulator [Mesorhizobium sp. M7A.F.Ca.CA.001.07.2.1]|uniref:LysR substrate-binding domain-containing protein n=1 Tax=Mesorhizobium TaxID=68287 RepID=UPI000FC9D840|nr:MULTISPECIES: LysR substrate-binding domain-containing protein [Mesorhizobium]MCF6123296.1 LysR substrate-binding domain-containing protein [Mesorhizobium ciceri]MCQ8815248.1 LysR substrate-binding domain-containing protein [Mesorhizobium sp. SEMIA396]RUX80324.1 LysR family transcriptional regulator [Mesorhizobium sp. M7A.F.Ca.CA.004.08.2.1]RUX84501.1 LysR family transcriptional regulator [Mesorhizobium sp. M7A.F.Ca.CA.004.08.1.1]RUY02852.1 LysR family transcriptional regulator [Mesorhizobi
MARPDINRSGEIEVFVRVVEEGSFSSAARALRMTPSAVSKLIARLEARLGARLVSRSTRKLQLTPEGTAFYESGLRILADMAAAEQEAAAGASPRGRLRVNSYVPFGVHRLIPLLPRFLERYPEISVDLVLTDSVIDLMAERADVAIRAGPLSESRLVARKLGQSPVVVVAAPSYLETQGTPLTPADLDRNNRMGFGFVRHLDGWPFLDADGRAIMVPITGNTLVSDGEAMRLMALAGAGIARLARWHVAEDMAAGRLVSLLEAFNPGDEEPTHAVYVGQGRHLPARVRAFLDFLGESVRLS